MCIKAALIGFHSVSFKGWFLQRPLKQPTDSCNKKFQDYHRSPFNSRVSSGMIYDPDKYSARSLTTTTHKFGRWKQTLSASTYFYYMLIVAVLLSELRIETEPL